MNAKNSLFFVKCFGSTVDEDFHLKASNLKIWVSQKSDTSSFFPSALNIPEGQEQRLEV